MKKNRLKRVSVLFLCAALLLTVAGCSGKTTEQTAQSDSSTVGSTAYPLTITDDLGNEVQLDAEPQRIVSLAPANTEILYALGLDERVVGRTDYCNYPEAASQVESVGNYNAPNVEKIIGLTPDLILSASTTFLTEDVRAQIEATGTKVIALDPQSIDAVETDIKLVGQICNVQDKAAELINSMETKRQAIKDKTAQAQESKKVFIDLGEYYTAGPGSLLDSMLTELNAVNIAGETGQMWTSMTTETIIADNPDVYISLYATADEIKQVAGFDQMKAVQDNAVYAYGPLSPEADQIQRGGPRIVDGLELLAKDIYPELMQ